MVVKDYHETRKSLGTQRRLVTVRRLIRASGEQLQEFGAILCLEHTMSSLEERRLQIPFLYNASSSCLIYFSKGKSAAEGTLLMCIRRFRVLETAPGIAVVKGSVHVNSSLWNALAPLLARRPYFYRAPRLLPVLHANSHVNVLKYLIIRRTLLKQQAYSVNKPSQ